MDSNKKLQSKRLSVHHIGGRCGSRSFPILDKFENDIVNVLYDADVDCVEQIRQSNQALKSQLYVLPYCVADQCKPVSVNINYDPFTSSLYDNNPYYDSFYYFHHDQYSHGDHDYVWSESAQAVKTPPMDAVTLDYIFNSSSPTAPLPDFLSIDTQGAEYDIISGAQKTIAESVVAVMVEAEFHPLYKEQKLFGDLTNILTKQGFHFVKFQGIAEMAPFRAPIGLRGDGFQVATDALFLRKLENITKEDPIECNLMIKKLAFIAIVFNQFEYALQCLQNSTETEVDQNSESVYLQFLREFEKSAQAVPKVYPDTFALKYPSFEASQQRFQASQTGPPQRKKRKIRAILEKQPDLLSFLHRTRDVINKGYQKLNWEFRLLNTPYSEIENFLISYGLTSQADVLRIKRFNQTEALKLK